MKLFNSSGPNPRTVRMFLLEKGLELPFVEVDLMGGENRRGPYVQKNPAGQLPALELDDGSVLGETVAICEYVEELHPEPALVGRDAKQRAETRMWTRRVEFDVTEDMMSGFRYGEGLKMFESRMRCVPEAAAGLKARGHDGLAWMDGLLEGRTWVAGARFTLADIVLYCRVDFCASVGQPLDPQLPHFGAWFERVNARPSATASLSPDAQASGMRV